MYTIQTSEAQNNVCERGLCGIIFHYSESSVIEPLFPLTKRKFCAVLSLQPPTRHSWGWMGILSIKSPSFVRVPQVQSMSIGSQSESGGAFHINSK